MRLNEMKNLLFACCPLAVSALCIACSAAVALPDNARVPVLTYHSWEVRYDDTTGQCDTESEALRRDLKVIYEEGYTVIPAYWLAQWVRGDRPGSSLPPKAVVLTMDDGDDADFLDNTRPHHPCAPLDSMRSVLEEAAEWDWGGPKGMPVPHMTTFVIASPEARFWIADGRMSENWWPSAAAHPLMEVQNHGVDHTHDAIPEGTWDATMELELPVAGKGYMNSLVIDTHEENDTFVRMAGRYIAEKTGMHPDLYAYPFGPASEYSKKVYFPQQSHTYASFCGGEQYVTKKSDLWCLPRFVHRSLVAWTDKAGLVKILRGAL